MSIAPNLGAGQLHRQLILATRGLIASKRSIELAKLVRHQDKLSAENRALLLDELKNAPNCPEKAEALRNLQPAQPILNARLLQRIPYSQAHERRYGQLSRLYIGDHIRSEHNPLIQQPTHISQFMTQMNFGIQHGMDKANFNQINYPAPTPELVSIHQPSDLITVRADAELTRIAIGLNLGAPMRLWLAGRHISPNGSGRVAMEALQAFNDASGRPYTPRHFRRLLAAGEGIFWRRGAGYLWLIGVQNVARKLTQIAADTNPELIATNHAGSMKDVYLPINGTHELFESRGLAGWLAARGNPTIALATLASLFGRHQTTISRWLRERLVNWTQPTKGDVQVISGVAAGDTGQRLPNTYWSYIRQHGRRGQSRKVAAASKDVVQPLDLLGEGQPRKRRYFDDREQLKRILRKHGTEDKTPRYLFADRRKYGLSERTTWLSIA